jgi:hypothetical protein
MTTNNDELAELIDLLSDLIEVCLEEGNIPTASALDICYQSLKAMSQSHG